MITKNYECSGIIIVEDKNGEIIGFNTYGASAPYRYGPVGVWEKYRGKGFWKGAPPLHVEQDEKTGATHS